MKPEFKVFPVRKSIRHLVRMLNLHPKVFYARFGDGAFEMIEGRPDGSHHTVTPELQKELKEAFSITDEKFMKAAVLGYPKEPGMRRKMFIEGSAEGDLPYRYLKTVKKITSEKTFYNPVVFHYLSVFNPNPLIKFVDAYIKPKRKMFIGGNDRRAMETFYGQIDYYVQTPRKEAYYSIDKWWPEIEKNVRKCQVVLPSVGIASSVVAKRLWNLGVEVHSIDIGSINNAIENKGIKSWIRRTGAKKIRENIGIEKNMDNLHRILKKNLRIFPSYTLPYVGRRRNQTRAMMFQIMAKMGYKKGAEIGVYKGQNSLRMFQNMPGLELLCVDPWVSYGTRSNELMYRYYQRTVSRLKNQNATVIRKTSMEASKDVKDESLDFVYIDGLHDFDNVMMDLILWCPKVRKGGVVSGHDYDHQFVNGVIEAVRSYTTAHGIRDIYVVKDTMNGSAIPPSFLWIKE